MLGRYKILHELGRGTTGATYAARDRETGAVVALKRLDPGLLNDSAPGLAQRFLKHARSARRLQHRNIVATHEAGEAAGTAYVAMEMLEGESLRRILERGPLPLARALRIAREIADALAYAHLEGVVHGGLKPSNIIVTRPGAAKVTDFGIAGCLGGMSPEQARGDPLDHRCDIFALGALLYEMLTGRPPAESGPRPPSELNAHVPCALDPMVLSMLAREPAARMPGMPILVRELRRLEEGRGLESAASLVPDAQWFAHMRERASRPQRSAWPQAVLFAGLALGIGLAGFIHFWPAAGDGIAAARSPAKQVSSGVLSIPEPTPPKPIAAEPAPLPVAEKPTAKLTLVVSPRGEIYVNGKHHGTTPPITTLDLEPGMHRIEVRNGSRKPYLTYMTVKAGDQRRIRHEFGHAPRGAR